MVTLELTGDEVRLLRRILEDYLGELRMEIANTDGQEYRDELKAEEIFIKTVLARIEGRP